MGQALELTVSEVLFGYDTNSLQAKAINYCILYAKSFISRMTYQSNAPFLHAFFVYLRYVLELEKFICCRNGDNESFEKHFGELFEAMM